MSSRTTPAQADLDAEVAVNRLSESQQMSELLLFTRPQKKETSIQALIKKIPLLGSLLHRLHDVNSPGISLEDQADNDMTIIGETVGFGFEFADIGLKAIDFLTIPAVYLGALIVGEKPPITLSKTARWLYSGLFLGLASVALAVPIAAPPIGLVMAGIGLGVSLFTMGKALYHRYQAPKELKAIEARINEETKELKQLQAEAIALEEKLLKNTPDINNYKQTMALRLKLDQVMATFHSLFNDKKPVLQTLYDQKFACEDLLKKHHTLTIMDKGMAITTAAIALVGLILTLFFPPIGAALMAASAVLGGVYLLGRVVLPLINNWVTRLINKINPPKPIHALHESIAFSTSHHQNPTVSLTAKNAPIDPISLVDNALPKHQQQDTTLLPTHTTKPASPSSMAADSAPPLAHESVATLTQWMSRNGAPSLQENDEPPSETMAQNKNSPM